MAGIRVDFRELSRAVLTDVVRCIGSVEPEEVSALIDAIAAKRKVFLIGTGRSGLMLQAMAVRLSHLGIAAHVIGSAQCPPVRKGDLVLVGSGSGETAVPLGHVRAARECGASIALITAAPDSSIAKLANTVLHVPAPAAPCAGMPHTLRSLFEECLLIICDCVCRMLQDRLGITAEDMQSRHSGRE